MPYIKLNFSYLLFSFYVHHNDREVEDLRAQLEFKDMHIKDSFRNLLNQKITESHTAVTSREQTIKKLSEEIFQLKKKEEKKVIEVTTLVRLHQSVTITDQIIPYAGAYVITDTLLPSFKDSTAEYSISGKVLPKGIHLQSLQVYDTVSFRITEKRTGLFKKATVIQTVHSNPYYTSLGTQSITLKKRTNAWNRWIKPTLFFGAGVFLKSKL